MVQFRLIGSGMVVSIVGVLGRLRAVTAADAARDAPAGSGRQGAAKGFPDGQLMNTIGDLQGGLEEAERLLGFEVTRKVVTDGS